MAPLAPLRRMKKGRRRIKESQELRELVRYWQKLVRERAAESNRIQKVLEGASIKLECTRKSGDFKRQSDKISQRGPSGHEKRTETK